MIDAKMKAELPELIKKTVKAISVKAPKKYNSYY